MTVTEIAGHSVKLFDTTFMNVAENLDNKIREKAGQVKPVTMDNFFNKKSKKQIEEAWLDEIEKFSPDLIATTIVEDSYEFCDRLLGLAKKKFNVPIVVGGSMPTVVPRIIIENPNIDYVIEAEGEVAMPELLNAINKTLFACGNDELRPVMSGMFCELSTEKISFVATDAHKLVKHIRNDFNSESNASFILPKKPLSLLKNTITEDVDLQIEYNETNAMFSFNSTKVICRLIDVIAW